MSFGKIWFAREGVNFFTFLKIIKQSIFSLAAAALLSIVGCSHTPSAADIPAGATFTANILADGTKLFVYRQRGFGAPLPREGEVGAPEQRERGPTTEQLQKAAKRGVDAMLAQNHYCREGYMVLEQYQQQRAYIVRGECRDAVNADERARFPAH